MFNKVSLNSFHFQKLKYFVLFEIMIYFGKIM